MPYFYSCHSSGEYLNFHSCHSLGMTRSKERIRKRRSAMPPMNRFVTLRFQFKKYGASKYAQRIEDTMIKFWRNESLNLILLGEKSHLKTYMELGW